jgi:hypothetical protein
VNFEPPFQAKLCFFYQIQSIFSVTISFITIFSLATIFRRTDHICIENVPFLPIFSITIFPFNRWTHANKFQVISSPFTDLDKIWLQCVKFKLDCNITWKRRVFCYSEHLSMLDFIQKQGKVMCHFFKKDYFITLSGGFSSSIFRYFLCADIFHGPLQHRYRENWLYHIYFSLSTYEIWG